MFIFVFCLCYFSVNFDIDRGEMFIGCRTENNLIFLYFDTLEKEF